jgi:hypothetical protein
MLEDMEELFKIDSGVCCCSCLPESRSGFLGFRFLLESQKSMNKIVGTSKTGEF